MAHMKLTQYQLTCKVASIYRDAREGKHTAEHIRDRMNACVWAELNSKTEAGRLRYSRLVYNYVSGYAHACWERVMNEEVEFCYLGDDDVLYTTSKKDSTHRSTDEFYDSGRGSELAKYVGNFYWKGTDKPYTEDK